MNIKEFKEGDVITRNEGMTYKHNGSQDGSYLGDRLILQGHDPIAKIIFLTRPEGIFSDTVLDLSYGRDPWDEGWCPYPETLWQKAKAVVTKK